MPEKESRGFFHTTRWTIVQQSKGSSDEAKAALSELCENYWQPVYLFLKYKGNNDDMSRELAQSFFEKVLSTENGFEGVRRERGRFRSYLLGALKNFLAERWRYERRQKRGGGSYHESLETGGIDEAGLEIPDQDAEVGDSHFDKEWAKAVLAKSIQLLGQEMELSGKAKQFQVLMPWVTGEVEGRTQSDAAEELGLRVGAVKVAVHRLRQRFGEIVRSEIAQTVNGEGEVDEEVRYLIEVMGER